MNAPIFDNIPEEPKPRRQWVNWKVLTRAGKLTKVPFQVNGIEGDSADPAKWTTYADVVEAYNKGEHGFAGIGFTFDPLDPYSGVDLDHCINADGTIKPKAKAILDKLNSYSEISPSGTGVKVLLKAKNPVSIRKKDNKFQQGFESKKPDLEIEIYYGYRFFTLTGNRLTDYPATIEDRNQELTEIFKDVFQRRNYFDSDSEPGPQREHVDEAEPLSPEAVERLQDLFDILPEFKSKLLTPASIGTRSDVEYHLCARLWEAGFSESEIYAIMSSSPQTKWLERDEAYRWETIKNAKATAEANHKERMNEKAAKEAAKKAEPIKLEDVADINYDEDGKIKKVRFSPTYAARVVLERMPLAMAEDSEDIYRFTGQIYRPDGARIIDRALCTAAGDLNTSDKLKETLRRIKNKLLDDPVVFEPDPYLLAVKNGVADLSTGEVREYRAKDLLLEQLDVAHDPAARCPAFLAFLESITPSVTDRLMLIDWFAATAIKEPLAYVLFLLGLGRNGKGIYEKLIKKFFGMASFRDMPLAEVEKNNFAASGFYRKRGWIASETGKKKTSIGTDFMKLVSGNGVIDSDRKNKSRIQFEPYFQTVVDTNTMPKIEDSSIGWTERFCKANLPYVFVQNPSKDNPLEKQRDPALFEKLSTPSELSGILNLILFRSPEIAKTKTITKRPGAEMFAEYNEQSSSVASFFDMFCEYGDALSNLWTPSAPIYEAYKVWCGFKVGEVVDKGYFGRQLKKFCGGVAPKQGKTEDRRSITLYKGLIFDQNKYQAALEALQLSMSYVCPKMSEVCPKNKEKNKGQQITMSEVSEANRWNEIIRRFGTLPKENILSEEKDENLPKTPKTLQTSASSEPVDSEPISDIPKTLPKTKTTEEQAEAKEEHFRKVAEEHTGKPPLICAACGTDIGPGNSSYPGGLCSSCGPKLPMVNAAMKAHPEGISLSSLWEALAERGRPPRKEHLPAMLTALGCHNGDDDIWIWEAGST